MVHSEGKLVVNVLLSVLRTDRVEQTAESREITSGRRCGNPVIQSHEVTRIGPTSRYPGAANPVGYDVGAALKVVNRPHSIPNHCLGNIAT